MSARCCEYPATYPRLRAQRARGTSALRVYYVWQCGFCGAAGADVPLKPPPKNDAGRKRGQSASGTRQESTIAKPKDAPAEALKQTVSEQTWSWLFATPQMRRWNWRVIAGGKS